MNHSDDDKAPIFGSWKGWYIAVLVLLVVEILLFAWFTNYFS